MTEQKHDDACGASRSDAWLEGPMWEAFKHRYSPGNPARPEDLEIFPKLKDAWETWCVAWISGAATEREACAKWYEETG